MSITVTLGNESQTFESQDEAWKYADELHNRLGGVPQVVETTTAQPVKAVSDFGGNLVHDAEAKVRIEALHSKLNASGVKVGEKNLLYAVGTRMAQVGYDTQTGRKAEHDAKTSVYEAANALRTIVRNEAREDVTVTAGELAKSIEVNGFAKARGLKLTEQAVRGLTTRLGSSALGHILGLRERVVRELAKEEKVRNVAAITADKAEIARILRHECERFADTTVKLRTRTGALQDIYAIVSPGYSPADAPAVLDLLVEQLPNEAKATFAYNPTSTDWELRAQIWTPTPVADQAVGEPFEGGTSFSSRDDGTSRLWGGGFTNFLACLNAGVYSANSADVSRVHRGRILLDIPAMVDGALKSVNALCDAWGYARNTAVEVPTGLKIEDAIPGFWRSILTERKSELAGVLKGRTEERVKQLSAAYFSERRNPEQVVRADFAQGWTKFIQSEPTSIRREAERAIGDWLVNNRKPLRYVGEE